MNVSSKVAVKDINKLPKSSGVYLFYGSTGASTELSRMSSPQIKKEIIYIGKAINIKDRVKNHFQQPSYRDKLFIDQVTSIGFIETDSEIEALVLEANLIKKHLPKFNIVWRDDKNYFYVTISKNTNNLPYIYITHQKSDSNSQYIGPFVEGNALKKTLKFLRKVFPYYTTSKHPKQKCTWCHLSLCPGPDTDVKEYKKNINKMVLILKGKRRSVLNSLKKEMSLLSHNSNFEEAGNIRDKMYALERVMEHTKVISNEQMGNSKWQQTEKLFKELLHIENSIKKVECYDISNIQGKQATGSMVVFINGVPNKSHYKKFRIKMKNEPNDIAMLKEVLTRRFLHSEWNYPEVILIDGGIAQLNVAINTKNKPESVKVISIAKGRQELFIQGRKEPIPLKDLPQDIYNLIKHLDDEAHRFAITYHKELRKRALGLNH